MDDWVPCKNYRPRQGGLRHRASDAYGIFHELGCDWEPTKRSRWYVFNRRNLAVAGPFVDTLAAKVWILAKLYGEGKL